MLLILGKVTKEDLTINLCIEKGMKVGKNCNSIGAEIIDYVH